MGLEQKSSSHSVMLSGSISAANFVTSHSSSIPVNVGAATWLLLLVAPATDLSRAQREAFIGLEAMCHPLNLQLENLDGGSGNGLDDDDG